MFLIQPTPWPEGPQNMGPRYGKRVVDHDRDAWLQIVHGSRRGVETMKLVWKDAVIPFDAILRRMSQTNEKPWYLWKFVQFEGTTSAQGWGYVDPSRGGVPPYYFSNETDRDKAQILAVEALIVYGSHYDGDTAQDGTYRVELQGKIYTKKDFAFV